MSSGPPCYERVAKAAKHESPDSVNHEVNAIGRFKTDSRVDTCCAGKNWRLLSITGQLCDVKGFNNSFESNTTVPVGISAK